MATKSELDILPIRRPSRDYLGVSEERRKWERAARDAEEMTPRELEKRCARAAAKAGKFLASARAIIEPELPYFLELRWRLNAQGQRGGVEGWQRWCEKHFSCDVRTVNRALSSILESRERTKEDPQVARACGSSYCRSRTRDQTRSKTPGRPGCRRVPILAGHDRVVRVSA